MKEFEPRIWQQISCHFLRARVQDGSHIKRHLANSSHEQGTGARAYCCTRVLFKVGGGESVAHVLTSTSTSPNINGGPSAGPRVGCCENGPPIVTTACNPAWRDRGKRGVWDLHNQQELQKGAAECHRHESAANGLRSQFYDSGAMFLLGRPICWSGVTAQCTRELPIRFAEQRP